ncbi:MAG: hypothetical protein CL849_03695 [Crocinitomicaceae bacterium]|nr:hypothetical protein [Crocinitomicaceae bacterium]
MASKTDPPKNAQNQMLILDGQRPRQAFDEPDPEPASHLDSFVWIHPDQNHCTAVGKTIRLSDTTSSPFKNHPLSGYDETQLHYFCCITNRNINEPLILL